MRPRRREKENSVACRRPGPLGRRGSVRADDPSVGRRTERSRIATADLVGEHAAKHASQAITIAERSSPAQPLRCLGGRVLGCERVAKPLHRFGRQVALDELGAAEALELALEPVLLHVAEQQREGGRPW